MNEIQKLTIAIPAQPPHQYEIQIGWNILTQLGDFARRSVGEKAQRVCLISNKKVFGLYGETAKRSFENSNFDVSVFLMPDGERHKNLVVLEKVLTFFSSEKLTRSDVVVALGGGVVGDLAGFAAAVFQRGVSFIQVPTTFLAQIDSSVGGKTAVNTAFGKNMVGAFHQPHGVLVDFATLQTLPPREIRAGLYEAVKHGAIASRTLFDQTQNILENYPPQNFHRHLRNDNFRFELQDFIAANIRFKAQIVSGDAREHIEREDAHSRRILNFGHTVGHALEKITFYKRFKHGEAVGLGMLAAAEISERIGKITKHELNLFSNVVARVGKFPQVADVTSKTVIKAFSHDKKVVGDSFKWILLDGLGQAAIVDNQIIPEKTVRAAIDIALKH